MLLLMNTDFATVRKLSKVLKVVYNHSTGDRKKVRTPRVKKYSLIRPQKQLKRKPSMLGFYLSQAEYIHAPPTLFD